MWDSSKVDADEIVAAILSVDQLLNGGNKIFTKSTVKCAPPRSTKKKYKSQAKELVQKWQTTGILPVIAKTHLLDRFPNVIDVVPFFKDQIRNSIVECNDPVEPLEPFDSSETNADTLDFSERSRLSDLADLSSRVWEDVVDVTAISGDATGSSESLEQMLGEGLVDFLMSTNRKKAEKITFQRILSHWAVACKIPHRSLTKLLKLLKRFNVTLSAAELQKLPSTGQTLLKLTPEDKGKVSKRNIVNIRGQTLGTYFHYGVRPGVLCQSPGLVEVVKQKELLRRVHLLHPNIFPPEVLEAIRPSEDEISGHVGSLCDPLVWDSAAAAAPSVVFRVQVSSDGVTPFKTEASSVRCIMGSLDCVHSPHLGITVPIPDSPPFFIGIYKGKEKSSDLVLRQVVDEFLELSPNHTSSSQVFCELSTWVADAVEKVAVCGTLSTAGKVSCPRCIQEGTKEISSWQAEHIPPKKLESVSNHMYFPKVDFIRREDALWNSYLGYLGKENQPYRKRQDVEVERLLRGKMVSAFPIEAMHSVAGGTCKDFIERIRSLRPRGGFIGCLTVAGKQIVDNRIVQLRQTMILEPARYIRSLDQFKEFKMREIHVMFHYYLYPIFFYAVAEMHNGEHILNTLKAKLLALHLTKGFSSRPIPREDLTDAKQFMKEYVTGCMEAFGENWATPKNHWLLHILDDCEKHQCHLDRLSAYKYENKYSDLGKLMRHGDKTLQQFSNRYCEIKKYTLPMTDDGEDIKDFALTPRALACMRITGSVELPPAFVHSVSKTPRSTWGKVMNCEGFKLLNKFPNNIALLSSDRVMYVIDLVHEIDPCDSLQDKFYLEGFLFKKLEPAFSVPQSSARIGFYRALHLDVCNVHRVPAIELQSKCFVFPRGPSSDRSVPRLDPVPQKVLRIAQSYTVSPEGNREGVKAKLRTQGTVFKFHDPSFASDYWWVHSLIVPGRFPNYLC